MQIEMGILSAILIFSFTANADKCKAVKWPYSKNIQKVKVDDLRSIERTYLDSYLYYELSTPVDKRTAGLAKKLLIYLTKTELNESKVYFYSALLEASDVNTNSPKVLQLQDICDLYTKITRGPSSVKTKVKSRKTP